jgi:hypothetical protein
VTAPDLVLATVADRYRIERELGRGGMATRAGQTAKARAVLDRMLAYARDHCLNPITLVAAYAALGDRDQAFAWLDRTVVDRTGWLWGIATWPEFDPLQQDPRLGESIRRMRLPLPAKPS